MAQNPHDMNVVNHLYAATGGSNVELEQRKEALRKLVGNDQRLMTPATMLVMNEEAKLRNAAMKQGQQPSVAAKALGFAPPTPQMSPAGLGATPQGMQMASAAPMAPPQGAPAPQGPVQMAGGGLTTLPVPDYMFDEQTFANGGIVAFSKGGQKGAADAKARAKQQAEAYLGKPISDAEFDLLLKATHAEASGKSNPEEQAMIMGTILNHARAKGKSIENVLYAPNAFQSVTGTSKNNHAPSAQFEKGPSDKRAADIFDAATLLPRVSPKQVNFTAANRKAYGPGTNVGYLDKLAKKGTQIAGTMFGTNIMPSDVQTARKEPPAPTIYDLARSTLPGISSAAAPPVRDARFDRPPIQYMAQPQMPRAQMPQFDVAAAEAPPVQVAQDARFDRPPIQYMAQPQMPRAQMPQFDMAAAEAPPVQVAQDARFERPPLRYMASPQEPQAQMPQFGVASAEVPTRATQVVSGLGAAASALNPIGTAQAAEAPQPKAQAQPPAEPYVDPVKKIPYFRTSNPLDPNKPMPSKARRYAGEAAQFVAGGLGNIGVGAYNAEADIANRYANFFTKPIDPNEGAPAAKVTPKEYGKVDKYTGPGNTKGVRHYTMGEDPAREAALTSNPTFADAPITAPSIKKETSEEALARILAANKSDNFWSTMAAAGFNTAAGKSQNALENFGSGFAAAIPGMAAANKSDRELALKQQELAQQKEISEKQISASTGFQKEAVDNLTQDYLRQGMPLVIARGRATRDVMTAGANQWSAGAPLNAQMKQLQSDIQYLEAVRPDDPSLPEKRKLLADAQAKFAALGSGGSGGGNIVSYGSLK